MGRFEGYNNLPAIFFPIIFFTIKMIISHFLNVDYLHICHHLKKINCIWRSRTHTDEVLYLSETGAVLKAVLKTVMKVTIRKGPLLFNLTTEGSEQPSYFDFYF